MSTKAAVAKKAAKRAARVSRPRVTEAAAAAAVEQVRKAADDLAVTAAVGVSDVRMAAQNGRDAIRGIAEVALNAVAKLDAKAEAAASDPGEKRLHRRVLVAVYDGEGTRLENQQHDLKLDDVLTVTVDGTGSVAKREAAKL